MYDIIIVASVCPRNPLVRQHVLLTRQSHVSSKYVILVPVTIRVRDCSTA